MAFRYLIFLMWEEGIANRATVEVGLGALYEPKHFPLTGFLKNCFSTEELQPISFAYDVYCIVVFLQAHITVHRA